LSVMPRLPEHLDIIQSIARQNSAGASIQLYIVFGQLQLELRF